MRRLIVGGLAALGIVGGTATVVYNHSGSATVKVTKNGVTRSVEIGGAPGGATYSCPEDVIEHEITPLVKVAGRIKLTLHNVESQLKAVESPLNAVESPLKTIKARYPSGRAPGAVASRYNDLLRHYNSLRSRYNRLLGRARALHSAFNRSIAKHNAALVRDCKS